jgi:hypothetical protein
MSSLNKTASRATKLDVNAMANGVKRTGQQVGRAGEQLGKIAGDIQRAGQTAERVGRLLAK